MLDVDTPSRDNDHTFKILLATDIHLGYNEKDPIRGNDSFDAFEEILQIAQEQNVDFILLGGDLFDSNKPSQYTLQQAVHLMRKYTFGDKEIRFGVVNDFSNSELHDTTAEIMCDAIPNLNYCDPNLNIAIPIFSIHGNHDDPTGMKSISTLNTLASMGYVNYFGRSDKLDSLEIRPLVLCKGESVLALYGVGHLADKRFVRLHRDGKMVFHKVNPDTAFQMLLLHQNRANRGSLNFIPYTMIPKFLDLVMWGHEHDCCIDPVVQNDVFYTQPGSSVATSLCEGESIPKKVGILYVHKKQFQIEPIQLKRQRIMIYRQFMLDPVQEMLDNGVQAALLAQHCEDEVVAQIRDMLDEARSTREENARKFGYDNDKLPSIRIVVQSFDERQSFHDRKLALVFTGQVANPQELVLQKRTNLKRGTRNANGTNASNGIDDDDDNDLILAKDVMSFVRKEVEQHFQSKVLSSSGALEAINRFVNCGDSHAFDDYITYRHKKIETEVEKVLTLDDNDEDIKLKVVELLARTNNTDETNAVRKLLEDPARAKFVKVDETAVCDDFNISDVDMEPAPKPARGRGSRGGTRGRGKRGAKTNAS